MAGIDPPNLDASICISTYSHDGRFLKGWCVCFFTKTHPITVMKTNLHRQLSILAALTASATPLIAAPRSLDTNFNGTGIAILLAGKDARSVVALPDGKIVVVGYTNANGNGTMTCSPFATMPTAD
jgi:hypothetical protein